MQDETRRKTSRARRSAGIVVLGGTLAALAAMLLGLALRASSTAPARTPGREPLELHPSGDFTHPTAGFPMPERVGSFERVAVTQYDEAGRDVSAGYNSIPENEDSWPVVATVYVYPAADGTNLDAFFDQLLREIGRRHGGAKPDFRNNILLANGRFAGRYSAFGFRAPFGGLTESIPLRSYVVLYRWNTWWVKWRVTTPAPMDPGRMKAIVTLTETLLPPEGEPDEPGGAVSVRLRRALDTARRDGDERPLP